MSAVAEREWQEWVTSWREDGAAARSEAAIRELVARQNHRLRVGLALECLVTVLVMGVVVRVVVAERTAAAITWGLVAAAHTAIIWAFTLWNRAGLWRPLSQAVGDYLAVALARARGEIRAARFAFWLVAGESVAIIAWLMATPRSPESPGSDWWWIPPTGVTATAIVWSIWFGRRARRQVERLQRLAAELDG